MDKKIKFKEYTAIQKSTAMLAALGFLINSLTAAGATNITAADGFGTTVTPNNNGVYDIETTNKNGENAFNRFNNFDLSANDIANMYFGTKQDNTAKNLFNFVDAQINVNGTVNAIKDNKIGGNLYFLSSSGMVVGNTGVINTGALFVMTPTETAYNTAVGLATRKTDTEGNIIPGTVYDKILPDENGKVTIPINPEGTITVQGKINAVDKIELRAANITIGDKENPTDANGNAVAVLATGVTDFKNLVNMTDEQLAALNIDRENLTAEKTEDGDIILSAKANKINKSYNAESIFFETDRTNIAAEINVNGEINSAGDVKIDSSALNGEVEENLNGEKEYSNAFALADVSSTINIGEGTKITSGESKDVSITSEAENVFESSALNHIGTDAPLELLGMATGINIDMGHYNLTSKSAINVAAGSEITSGGKLTVDSQSVAGIEAGASTTFFQLKDFIASGTGVHLPSAAVAVVNSDSTSNINIEGNLTAKSDIDINSTSKNALKVSVSAGTIHSEQSLVTGVLVANGENNSSVVIKGDVNSEEGSIKIGSLAESSVKTEAGAKGADKTAIVTAVNVTQFDSSSDINIEGNLTAKKDVEITAENILTDNEIVANNSIGTSSFQNKVLFENEDFNNFTNALQTGIKSFLHMNTDDTGDSQKKDFDLAKYFGAGATVSIVLEDNTSSINIGKDASVKSTEGKVSLNSLTEIEDLHLVSTGKAHAQREEETKTLEADAAVTYGDFNNDSTIKISGDITGNDININSEVKMEYNRVNKMVDNLLKAVEELKSFNLSAETKDQLEKMSGKFNDIKNRADGGELNGATEILEALGAEAELLGNIASSLGKETIGDLGEVIKEAVQFVVLNNYGNVYSSVIGTGSEKTTVVTGNVAWTELNNSSKVVIDKGAKITAEAGNINITSKNTTEAIGIAGTIVKSNVDDNQNSKTAVGGTFIMQQFDTSSIVAVGEGAELTAKENTKETENINETGNININAGSDIYNVSVAASAGKGKNGISGMVNYSKGNSDNRISIDDKVLIDAEKNINIAGRNNTNVTNIAGAFSMANGNASVGIGVAINDFTVNNNALIQENSSYIDNLMGREETENQEETEKEYKIAASSFDMSAKTEGTINAVGAAGSVMNNDDSGTPSVFQPLVDKYNKVTDKIAGGVSGVSNYFTGKLTEGQSPVDSVLNTGINSGQNGGQTNTAGASQAQTPSFSFGLTVSSGINILDNETNAIIDGAKIDIKNGDIKVSAVDESFTGAWAGEMAVQWQNTSQGNTQAVGIGGAVGLNFIGNDTKAIIKDSTITGANNIIVDADSRGTQVAAGLAAGISRQGGEAGAQHQVQASVSLNDITHDVTARMENNIVNNTTEDKKTNLFVSAEEEDTQVTGGFTGVFGKTNTAIGGTVAIATLNNNVTAEIKDGIYKNIENVSVNSLLGVTQVTAAASIGVTKGNNETALGTITGAVVYNNTNNIVNAGIKGATIEAENGNINVTAGDVVPAINLSEDNNVKEEHDNYLAVRGIDSTGKYYYENLDTETQYKNNSENENTPETFAEESNQGPHLENTKNGSTIVSAAAVVGINLGDDSSVGAGVAIDNIKNTFNVSVEDAVLTADSINANASADTFLVGAAGGVAASKGSFGAMGSVSWQEIANDIGVKIVNSTLTANSIKAETSNTVFEVNVGGQVSAGKDAAVGAVLAYSNINNSTKSEILGGTITADDILVKADSDSDIYTVGAAVAASTEQAAIAGTVSLNRVNNTTTASIGKVSEKDDENEGEAIETTLNGVKTLNVTAVNDDNLMNIVAGITGASKAAVGGAVAYSEITSNVSGNVINTDITTSDVIEDSDTERAINILADDKSDSLNVAVAVGGAGKAAVEGAASTSIINKTVNAELENSNIDTEKDGNVDLDITANNSGSIISNATVGAFAGKAGVGAGVAVNTITQATNAVLNGGVQNVKEALVKGKAEAEITTIGVGAAVGGQGAGVAGSVAVNTINNNTNVLINNAILTAKGNAGIIAENDEVISNYAGTLGVAGQGAGVGASVSINEIAGDTKAGIENSEVTAKGETDKVIEVHGTVDNMQNSLQKVDIDYKLAEDRDTVEKKGVVVDSSGTHTIKSLLATAGVAGQGAGVGGTVNVNKMTGNTSAGVLNSAINKGLKTSDVSIHSGDYTESIGIVGAVGGTGQGAGVGLASDTNIISRKTGTLLVNSDIYGKDIKIDAESKQGISSFSAGAGIAGQGAGVAGSVSVSQLDGETSVEIYETKDSEKEMKLDGNTIDIKANHVGDVIIGNVGLGIAAQGAGVGASVGVTKDNTTTKVSINNAELTSDKDTNIMAENQSRFKNLMVSGGVGIVGAGVSGTVSVNNITNKVITELNNTKISSANSNVNIDSKNNIITSINTNGVGGGIAGVTGVVTVNTINSTVNTGIIGGSIIANNGKIDISAEETRDIDQLVISAALGGVAAGANVAINSIGTAVVDREDTNIGSTIDEINKEQDSKLAGNKLVEQYITYMDENDEKQVKDFKVEADKGEIKGNGIKTQISSAVLEGKEIELLAKEHDDINIKGGGGTAGVISASGSVGITDIERDLGIIIDGNAKLDAKEKLTLKTEMTGTAKADLYQGSLGAIGLGAAYGEINTTGNSLINIKNSTLSSGKDIEILVDDKVNLENNSSGLTVGLIGAGAIIAKSENESNLKIEIEEASIKAENKNNISTERTGETTVTAMGGSVGIVSGVGVEATAKDGGTNSISITGNQNTLEGKELTISAISSPKVKAEVGSLAVGALAGVGVSNSYALYSGKTTLNIAAGNNLIGNNINLGAGIITQDGKNSLEAKTVANGGGRIAGVSVNEAKAENNSTVIVNIGEENYSKKDTKETVDVNISAMNNTKIKVTAEGLNIGGTFASGTNQATSISTGKTEINANGGTADNFSITAGTNTEVDSHAKGDGGGLVDVSPYAAILDNKLENSTVINLSGNWNVSESLSADAQETDILKLNISSTKGGGIAVNGLKLENSIKNNDGKGTEVNFLNGTKILGSGSVTALAQNSIDLNKSSKKKVESTDDNPSGWQITIPEIAEGNSYGGAAAQLIIVDNDIIKDSKVNIAENVLIDTNNQQTYDAKTTGEINLRGTGAAAGAGSGTDIKIDNDMNFDNKVSVGANSQLKTEKADQDITLAANDIIQVRVSTIAEADGAVGVAKANSENNLIRNNTVEIASSGKLHSMNNVNLYAGKESSGAESNMKLKVSAETFSDALVSVPLPDMTNDVYQNNHVIINSGTAIDSVGSINLDASTGSNDIEEAQQKYSWHTKEHTSDYATTESGQTNPKLITDNYVKADGNLSAGIYAKQDITIEGIFNRDPDIIVVDQESNPAKIYGTLNGKEITNEDLDFKTENYTNTLMQRYEELEKLISENSEPNNSAYQGYLDEKKALLTQMVEAGVAVEVDGKIRPSKSLDINYIEIPDIVASGGNITINSDNFIGNGNLSATGDPVVNIVNKSNLYLKIGNIKIGEAGGKVTFNGRDIATGDKNSQIKDINLNYKADNQVDFKEINVTKNGDVPLINIFNDGITSFNIKTEIEQKDGSLKLEEGKVDVISNIEINGNVVNTIGDITIENKTGSILQQAKSEKESSSIIGTNVSMKASGSIVQGSSEGMVQIADEKSRWEDEQNKLQSQLFGKEGNGNDRTDSALSDKTNLESDIDTYWEKNNKIAGGSIILSATDINVNGLIQSGVKDYKLELGENEQKIIADYDTKWANSKGTNLSINDMKTHYKLNDGGYKYDKESQTMYYVVQTYYNPVTKEIIVEDINPTGGQIYLTGRIMSTGNGKIVALDGAADINIKNNINNNNINLTLGNISNGNSKGLISITDFIDGKYVTTKYTTDGGVTSYEYKPQEGLRYNWTNGTKSTTKKTYTWSTYFSWWGLRESPTKKELQEKDGKAQVGDEVTTNGDEKLQGYYITKVDTDRGTFVVDYSNKVNTDPKDVIVSDPRTHTEYKNWTHWSGWDIYEWDETYGTTQSYVNSLKADEKIKIEFITSQNGGTINVDSTSGVVLNGNLKNSSLANTNGKVDIKTNDSIIRKGGSIYSDDVILKAGKDIEDIKITSINDNVNLLANANGNVSISVKGDYGKAGNTIVNSITGKNISLVSAGDIIQKDNNLTGVTGNRINLVSTDGSIDLKINMAEELIDLQDSMSTSVSASAKKNINLEEVSGDMRIGKIESIDGDISLKADGYLLDALPDPNEEVSSRGDIEEKIESWQSAGLIEGSSEYLEKRKDEANEYKAGVKKEYENYLALKDYFEGGNAPTAEYLKQLEEKYEDKDAYNSMIKDYEKSKENYAKLQEKYANVKDVDDYLAKDTKYKELTAEPTFKWTKEQLLYAIKDSIANPETGSTTDPKAKDVNIVGKNITIETGKGVGKDAGQEVINLNELADNNYANMKKLASAEAADVVWNEEAGIATISNKKALGIKLTDSSGKLNVNARENIYLAVRNGEGDGNSYNAINVGQITTGKDKDIRLFGIGGIFNAANNTNINFTGNNLILEGGNSDLGAENNELTTNLVGTLTARTNENIYINQKSNSPMKVAAIYAGKDIVLKSQQDILSVGELGYINSVEGNIILEAEGSIGNDSGGALRIKNNELDKNIIIAKAGENVYLVGKNSGADAETGTGSEVIRGEEPPKEDTEVQIEDKYKGLTLEQIEGNGIIEILGESNLKVGNITNKPDDLDSGITNLEAAGRILLDKGAENKNTEIITNKLIMTAKTGNINQIAANTINANTVTASAVNGIDLSSDNSIIKEITLTNNTGDILVNNVGEVGEEGLTVNITKENAGNINITNAKGDVKVISDVIATGVESDVIIENAGSIIFAEDKNIEAERNVLLSSIEVGNIVVNNAVSGKEMKLSTVSGDINVVNAKSGTDMNISTITGDITVGTLETKIGNLTANTSTGDIIIDKGTINGLTDISTLTDGNIKLGVITSKDNLIAATNKGNITIGEAISETGKADALTGTGDITITNLTAQNNVNIKAEIGGNITSTGKLSSVNESLLVHSANGDINLNEVYAADQAKVYAKKGNIVIQTINGDYVIITMGSKDHKMDVAEQIVGKGSMLSSNDITIENLSQREGYTNPVEVTFNNSEDNINSPINNAELHAKGLQNGLLITQLWAKNAEITTDGEILQLPKLNITGIGHFANNTTTTTVYGKNAGYDNTDISIWNQASLTAPTESDYIVLNFTNEPNTTETDGILLKVTDGFKVYAEREAGEEIMMEKLRDFEKEINKSYILNNPFEYAYKPYLNYNLIDNNMELIVNMPEIIVTKDKIIISKAKVKQTDKKLSEVVAENVKAEEEKIAQK